MIKKLMNLLKIPKSRIIKAIGVSMRTWLKNIFKDDNLIHTSSGVMVKDVGLALREREQEFLSMANSIIRQKEEMLSVQEQRRLIRERISKRNKKIKEIEQQIQAQKNHL